MAYAVNSTADLFALTETWFTYMDVAHRVEATPPGSRLLDKPRKNRVGGGTALIFREHFHVTKIAGGEVDLVLSTQNGLWLLTPIDYDW